MKYMYGCEIIRSNYRDDVYETLARMLEENSSALLEEFEKYKKGNEGKPGFAMMDGEELFHAFVDEYESPDYSWADIEGAVTDLINEKEFDGRNVFECEFCCIAVMPDIPADDGEMKYFPTQERIREILAKYLNPLLKEPVTVRWLEFCE